MLSERLYLGPRTGSAEWRATSAATHPEWSVRLPRSAPPAAYLVARTHPNNERVTPGTITANILTQPLDNVYLQ